MHLLQLQSRRQSKLWIFSCEYVWLLKFDSVVLICMLMPSQLGNSNPNLSILQGRACFTCETPLNTRCISHKNVLQCNHSTSWTQLLSHSMLNLIVNICLLYIWNFCVGKNIFKKLQYYMSASYLPGILFLSMGIKIIILQHWRCSTQTLRNFPLLFSLRSR